MIYYGGGWQLPPSLEVIMCFLGPILIGLFFVTQPYTVSTSPYLCNKGKCPKFNCFVGWQYKGYDTNGRLFTTCRSHTVIGQVVNETHEGFWKYLKDK